METWICSSRTTSTRRVGTAITASTNKIYFNDGAGNFSAAVTIGADQDYTGNIRTGDLDNDGDLDIIVTNYLPEAPDKIYFNDGYGVFSGAGIPVFSESDWSTCIDLGDVDGDGDLDAVVGTYHNVDRVYFNDGSGGFFSHVDLDYSEQANSVRLGDLDGDGDLDVVVGFIHRGGESVAV